MLPLECLPFKSTPAVTLSGQQGPHNPTGVEQV
jgi:hypothetical protein